MQFRIRTGECFKMSSQREFEAVGSYLVRPARVAGGARSEIAAQIAEKLLSAAGMIPAGLLANLGMIAGDSYGIATDFRNQLGISQESGL